MSRSLAAASIGRSLDRSLAATSTHRNEGLDAMRFLSAMAVVWIHTSGATSGMFHSHFCRFAVPFFSASSAYFVVRHLHRKRPSLALFSWDRAKRLILPFLVWSLVYLAFKGIKRLVLPGQACELPGWEFLWQGGAYHLWFIPFLVVASLSTWFALATCKSIASLSSSSGIRFPFSTSLRIFQSPLAGAFSLAIATLLTSLIPYCNGTTEPWYLALQATPAWLLGGAIAWWSLPSQWSEEKSPSLPIGIVAACTAWCALLVLEAGARNDLLETLSGVSLLVFSLSLGSFKMPSALVAISSTAMGVYYMHLLGIKIGESVVNALHMPGSPLSDLILFGLVLSASTLFSWCLSRSKRLAFLVQ